MNGLTDLHVNNVQRTLIHGNREAFFWNLQRSLGAAHPKARIQRPAFHWGSSQRGTFWSSDDKLLLGFTNSLKAAAKFRIPCCFVALP